MVVKLKYGNTNTYFLKANDGVLIDTDMAGTLPAFYKEIKRCGIAIHNIKYVISTHYHPDHMGLISELMRLGIKLLLVEHQKDFVHFSDAIFKRQPRLQYTPIDENEAIVFSCDESRQFLYKLGIQGEIIPTHSHSDDGIALILDNGQCFVGDLEPMEYIESYSNNESKALKDDWKRIISFNPQHIYFGHANSKKVSLCTI